MTGGAQALAPRPVPFWKRFRRELRVRALLLALPLLSRLPHRLAVALGALVGTCAYYLAGGERRLALSHLALAFPQATGRWRRRVARRCFGNLGRSALELAAVQSFAARLPEVVELDEPARALLADAHAEGKGGLFVCCHIGNWELLARRIVLEGYSCGTVARETSDPRITALLEASRGSVGLRTLWRGKPGLARDLLKLLRGGGLVGMLIDQDTKVQGQFVPFFGKLAFTPRAASDLAIRTRAPAIFGCVHRVSPTRHRIVLRRVPLPSTGDRDRDSLELTAALTREIEAEVRATPEEWVWMHPRWRTRPPELSENPPTP